MFVEWREQDEGRPEMPREREFIPEYEGKQKKGLILDFEEPSIKLQIIIYRLLYAVFLIG